MLKTLAVALPLTLAPLAAAAEPPTTAPATAPAARWVNLGGVGIHLVEQKKPLALTADAAALLFTRGATRLAEDWEKQLQAAGKVEPADQQDAVPLDANGKPELLPPADPATRATLLGFSDTHLRVAILKPLGGYRWHQYDACLADLLVPRTRELDATFDVAELSKTYAATYRGLGHGDSADAVKKTLGEPDATIHSITPSYFRLVYLPNDRIFVFENGALSQILTGVPEDLKEEIKAKGPNVTR